MPICKSFQEGWRRMAGVGILQNFNDTSYVWLQHAQNNQSISANKLTTFHSGLSPGQNIVLTTSSCTHFVLSCSSSSLKKVKWREVRGLPTPTWCTEWARTIPVSIAMEKSDQHHSSSSIPYPRCLASPSQPDELQVVFSRSRGHSPEVLCMGTLPHQNHMVAPYLSLSA